MFKIGKNHNENLSRAPKYKVTTIAFREYLSHKSLDFGGVFCGGITSLLRSYIPVQASPAGCDQ